jgi:hypothetical protein
MGLLLYCIIQGSPVPMPAPPAGISGQPLRTICYPPLHAVVSRHRRPHIQPDQETIQTYGRIIEWYHQHFNLIPLRFGYLLSEASQVERLLREHLAHFTGLLEDLQDCVEMGVRLFLPRSPLSEEGEGPDSPPGLAYLACRKRHFDREDRESWTADHLEEEICRSLAGLYLRHCRECQCLTQGRLLSLHFLVPRKAQAAFREVARAFGRGQAENFLLSGPWPPYNFVSARGPLRNPGADLKEPW